MAPTSRSCQRPVARRRQDEQCRHEPGQRPYDLPRQQHGLDVDHRERQQPGEEDEERRERPVVAEPSGETGEQRGTCQLDQRVTGRDRFVAVSAAPPQQYPRQDGDVVAFGYRGAA